MYCKDCKYCIMGCWTGPHCDCPKMKYGYGYDNPTDDTVVIEHDEGWGMKPGPFFGCIHFEEK